jgi:hypothetical protein
MNGVSKDIEYGGITEVTTNKEKLKQMYFLTAG